MVGFLFCVLWASADAFGCRHAHIWSQKCGFGRKKWLAHRAKGKHLPVTFWRRKKRYKRFLFELGWLFDLLYCFIVLLFYRFIGTFDVSRITQFIFHFNASELLSLKGQNYAVYFAELLSLKGQNYAVYFAELLSLKVRTTQFISPELP